jgi:FtsZ-binding cell division protein ZapB
MQEDKPEVARLTRELAVEMEKVVQRDRALADAKDAIQQAWGKMAELKEDRLRIVKEFGDAVAARERYKRERNDLTTLLRQANAKIRELIEDKG